MKIEVGKKVKLLRCSEDGREKKNKEAKIGVISAVFKHYVEIQFKNYKESFTNADVIAPKDWILYVRKDKEWVQVTKEMLE